MIGIINGKNISIHVNDVVGVVVATDHKGITSTQIILNEKAVKSNNLTSGIIPVKTTYLETMLKLLTEQAQQNFQPSKADSFISAMKADIKATKEWLKNVFK